MCIELCSVLFARNYTSIRGGLLITPITFMCVRNVVNDFQLVAKPSGFSLSVDSSLCRDHLCRCMTTLCSVRDTIVCV